MAYKAPGIYGPEKEFNATGDAYNGAKGSLAPQSIKNSYTQNGGSNGNPYAAATAGTAAYANLTRQKPSSNIGSPVGARQPAMNQLPGMVPPRTAMSGVDMQRGGQQPVGTPFGGNQPRTAMSGVDMQQGGRSLSDPERNRVDRFQSQPGAYRGSLPPDFAALLGGGLQMNPGFSNPSGGYGGIAGAIPPQGGGLQMNPGFSNPSGGYGGVTGATNPLAGAGGNQGVVNSPVEPAPAPPQGNPNQQYLGPGLYSPGSQAPGPRPGFGPPPQAPEQGGMNAIEARDAAIRGGLGSSLPPRMTQDQLNQLPANHPLRNMGSPGNQISSGRGPAPGGFEALLGGGNQPRYAMSGVDMQAGRSLSDPERNRADRMNPPGSYPTNPVQNIGDPGTINSPGGKAPGPIYDPSQAPRITGGPQGQPPAGKAPKPGAPAPSGDRSLDVNPDGTTNYGNIAARYAQEPGYEGVTEADVKAYHDWVTAGGGSRGNVDFVDWYGNQPGATSPLQGRRGYDTYRYTDGKGTPLKPPSGGRGEEIVGQLPGAAPAAPAPGQQPGPGGSSGWQSSYSQRTPQEVAGLAPGSDAYISDLMQKIGAQRDRAMGDAAREIRHQGGVSGMANSGAFGTSMASELGRIGDAAAERMSQAALGVSEAERGRSLQEILGRMGLEGTREQADASRFGASQAAGASAYRSDIDRYLGIRGQDIDQMLGLRGQDNQLELGYAGLDVDRERNFQQNQLGWSQQQLDYMRQIFEQGPDALLRYLGVMPQGGFYEG